MEFNIDVVGGEGDGRSVKVAIVDRYGHEELRLAVVVENEFAVHLDRSQALALAGVLRAMARTLD